MSCPDCFSGHVSPERPTGHEATVHGLPTYIAEPPAGHAPQGIIVLIPDAFGWRFVNSRILADHYAARGGFRVFLPEVMGGWATPVWMVDVMPKVLDTSGVGAWLVKPYYLLLAIYAFLPFHIMNRFRVSMPKVEAYVSAIRTVEAAHLPLGAAGFCWSGRHALHLASEHAVLSAASTKPLVDAVFAGHPSHVAIPTELASIRQPVSVAIGDKDFVMSISKVREMERILTALETRTEVLVYEGAKHGFCVRPDPTSATANEQKMQAEDQAVAWFTRIFGLAGPSIERRGQNP